MPKLKRNLYGPNHPKGPSRGADVLFVKRALRRAGNKLGLGEMFFTMPRDGFNDIYNEKTVEAVNILRSWQQRRPFTGPFRQDDLDALWAISDRYGKWLYLTYKAPKPKTPQDLAWERLLRACEEMSRNTPGYQLGGGHGVPLHTLSTRQKLDCSSSTSLALWEAGMFNHHTALVSGQLESWGLPGEGRYFTLYANYEHVWLRLKRGRYWRFDTSPHGDGSGSGPRLRYTPRFSSRFVARHWKGM